MAKIQFRRGTTAQWESANPILDSGELGLNTTTGSIKFGDGVKRWKDLPISVTPGSISQEDVEAAVADTLDGSGIVTGAVSGADPEGSPAAGGFIGENGRVTEIVFDDEGRVLDGSIEAWAPRISAKMGIETTQGYSSAGVGGFVGENGRETDATLTADGSFLDSTVARLAGRLASYFAPETEQSRTVEDLIPAGRRLWVRNSAGAPVPATSSPDQYAAWGDSLTDGWTKPPFAANQSDAWPGALSTLLGKPVYNGGKSGQSSDEIALRQGGLALMITVTSGTIAASGDTPVTYPADQVIGWRLAQSWDCGGTLAGVPGILSRLANAPVPQLVFRRTGTGTAVPVTGPIEFIPSGGMAQRDSTSIFFAGRNDIGYVSAAGDVSDRIAMATIAMVEGLRPAHPRFIILGTLNAANEGPGSSGQARINYQDVVDSNKVLAEMYPNNFLPIRDHIIHESIYEQGITPTADDLARMANDAPPMSVMLDAVHFNVPTAATIAGKIHQFIIDKGWKA